VIAQRFFDGSNISWQWKCIRSFLLEEAGVGEDLHLGGDGIRSLAYRPEKVNMGGKT